MIKAIIFDLDDTLYPELEFVRSGFFEVAKSISEDYKIDFNNCYQELTTLFTNGAKNVFNRFFAQNNLSVTNEYIFKLIQIYREHFPTISFYDDVPRVISSLRKKGYFLGIISDGFLVSQENKIKALECEKYFDHIILTDKLGNEFWKPHSRSFELMANFLQINIHELMYIGDNPEKDFYISTTHQVHTVRIIRQKSIHANKKYLDEVKEIDLIQELSDIFKILEKVNGK